MQDKAGQNRKDAQPRKISELWEDIGGGRKDAQPKKAKCFRGGRGRTKRMHSLRGTDAQPRRAKGLKGRQGKAKRMRSLGKTEWSSGEPGRAERMRIPGEFFMLPEIVTIIKGSCLHRRA